MNRKTVNARKPAAILTGRASGPKKSMARPTGVAPIIEPAE